jgi:CDP-diacylglycerol--serine O-phosphatidyltransferase
MIGIFFFSAINWQICLKNRDIKNHQKGFTILAKEFIVMNIKKHIPNLVTLGNLFCGTLATIFAVSGHFELTALFVVFGIFLDFFDGFFARILKVSGELGKQLDSLADMVTSGVVPGIVLFYLLGNKEQLTNEINDEFLIATYIPLIGLIITLAACYRLAKFNIDTRQSESFIGLPTPAMSLFVVFLPLVQMNTEIDFVRTLISNNYFLIGVTILFSYLMNAELPLFSLKFKNYGLKENVFKYILIMLSLVLMIALEYLAVPVIIMSYLLLSIINNLKHTIK